MHHAYLPPDDWSSEEVYLTPEESKHLVSVLRATEGDEVILFDGTGTSALASISRIEGTGRKTAVQCRILKNIPHRSPSTKLTLLQALPKGNRMDFLVEKATELGAWEIVPLKTERVLKQAGGKGFDGQVDRWNRVALSAAKQCGSAWLPTLGKVQSLTEGLASVKDADLILVCVLDDEVQSLGECIESFGSDAKKVAVLIGPEGDLTRDEIDAAIAAGAKPVSFGKLVLRVETAAIYAASVLKNHFCWDAWE